MLILAYSLGSSMFNTLRYANHEIQSVVNFRLTWVHLRTKGTGPSLLSRLGWCVAWWSPTLTHTYGPSRFCLSVNWQTSLCQVYLSLFLKQRLWKVQNAHLHTFAKHLKNNTQYSSIIMFQISHIYNYLRFISLRFTKPKNTMPPPFYTAMRGTSMDDVRLGGLQWAGTNARTALRVDQWHIYI